MAAEGTIADVITDKNYYKCIICGKFPTVRQKMINVGETLTLDMLRIVYPALQKEQGFMCPVPCFQPLEMIASQTQLKIEPVESHIQKEGSGCPSSHVSEIPSTSTKTEAEAQQSNIRKRKMEESEIEDGQIPVMDANLETWESKTDSACLSKIPRCPVTTTTIEESQEIEDEDMHEDVEAAEEGDSDAGIGEEEEGSEVEEEAREQAGSAGEESDANESGSEADEETPQRKKLNMKMIVESNLRQSHYSTVYRMLLKKSKAAHGAFMNVYHNKVKAEASQLRRSTTQLPSLSRQFFEPDDPANKGQPPFSWDEVVLQAQENMPWLFTTLNTAMPTKLTVPKHVGKSLQPSFTAEEAAALRETRLGNMLSICAFSNAPNKYKYLQSSMEDEIRKQGGSDRAVQLLHDSGLLTDKLAKDRKKKRSSVLSSSTPVTSGTSTDKDGNTTYFGEYSEITLLNNSATKTI